MGWLFHTPFQWPKLNGYTTGVITNPTYRDLTGVKKNTFISGRGASWPRDLSLRMFVDIVGCTKVVGLEGNELE